MRAFKTYGIMTLAGMVWVYLLAGCQGGAPPATAVELAEGLRGEGISYTSTRTLPAPTGRHFRFDEGIALVADDLWVEVIRIEDERTYGVARDGSAFLAIAQVAVDREFPGMPDIYARQPFIVVVRQEPASGQVLNALNKILPESS